MMGGDLLCSVLGVIVMEEHNFIGVVFGTNRNPELKTDFR